MVLCGDATKQQLVRTGVGLSIWQMISRASNFSMKSDGYHNSDDVHQPNYWPKVVALFKYGRGICSIGR